MELIPTTVKLPSPPVAVLTIEPKVAETATAPFLTQKPPSWRLVRLR